MHAISEAPGSHRDRSRYHVGPHPDLGADSPISAAVTWSIGLRARIWESASTALRRCPAPVALLIPGLIRLSLAERAGKLSLVPDRVREQPGPAVAGTGRVIAEVGSKGPGLRHLIGALMSLRDESGDIARVAAEGTVRCAS